MSLRICTDSDKSGSIEAEWAWFGDAATSLEFVNSTLGFDTRQMGLRCDGWRREFTHSFTFSVKCEFSAPISLHSVLCTVAGSLPLATTYRPWVRQHFDGISSFAGNQSIGLSRTYTPAAAAIRAGASPTVGCHTVAPYLDYGSFAWDRFAQWQGTCTQFHHSVPACQTDRLPRYLGRHWRV